MEAMVFAAGLGTRLHPLTQFTPKAMVKLKGRPLIDHVIKRLVEAGVESIVVNVHHYAEQIIGFIESQDYGVPVYISDERTQLLDTGGGLKFASKFFTGKQPILIHNVDVYSDIDFGKMLQYHQENDAIATLAVRSRETSRYLLFDDYFVLKGWENMKTGAVKLVSPDHELNRFAFSGIHIVSPQIFEQMHDEGTFSIIDLYLKLVHQSKIQAFTHDDSFWMDIGRVSHLNELEKLLE
ncbi:MAG: nucleotidyltransferase family protein [Bacteroidales bacterium]|nr:nucleotidyltransferase family protein [Bacteroidales bacterium]